MPETLLGRYRLLESIFQEIPKELSGEFPRWVFIEIPKGISPKTPIEIKRVLEETHLKAFRLVQAMEYSTSKLIYSNGEITLWNDILMKEWKIQDASEMMYLYPNPLIIHFFQVYKSVIDTIIQFSQIQENPKNWQETVSKILRSSLFLQKYSQAKKCFFWKSEKLSIQT